MKVKSRTDRFGVVLSNPGKPGSTIGEEPQMFVIIFGRECS